MIGYYRDTRIMTYRPSKSSLKTVNSKAICILGMHRSGTSLLSRAVNLLGAYLGEDADIIEADADNPLGYWERKDIINLHSRILSQFKRSWDATIPLPDKWYLSEVIQPLRDELSELVKDNYGGKQLWAWKDPRTAVLLPLWKDVVRELGVELVCLFTVRNPLDVARSLEVRDGFTKDKSFGIWLNHNLAGLMATKDLKRAFVSYDRFLADWQVELRRCAAGLSIDWPREDSILKAEMVSFIRPELRHSASTAGDLKRTGAQNLTVELHGLLESLLDDTTQDDSNFDSEVQRLWEDYLSYVRLFGYRDTGRVSEQDWRLTTVQQELLKKDRQVRALINSRSWKITAPMRRLHEWYKHVVAMINPSRS